MLSGDANGDGVVDPSDIFYIVNYLFMSGPAPAAEPSTVSTQAVAATLSGAVTLGEPVLRGGRYVVPVMVSSAPGSEVPQALSLRVVFKGPAGAAAIHHTAGVVPAFEISRTAPNALSYLLVGDRLAGVIAEIELDAQATVSIDVDPALTLLSNQGGTRSATVAAGTLRVSGTSIDVARPLAPRKNME